MATSYEFGRAYRDDFEWQVMSVVIGPGTCQTTRCIALFRLRDDAESSATALNRREALIHSAGEKR